MLPLLVKKIPSFNHPLQRFSTRGVGWVVCVCVCVCGGGGGVGGGGGG